MENSSDNGIPLRPYLGNSPTMMEAFLIVGYESYIIDNLVKKLEEQSKENAGNREKSVESGSYLKSNSSSSFHKEKNTSTCDNSPKIYGQSDKLSIINIVASHYCTSSLDSDLILKRCFPFTSGGIFFQPSQTENQETFQEKNEIFTHQFYEKKKQKTETKTENDNEHYFGFVYKFYEIYELGKEGKLYFPKAFCILSDYPYFSFFKYVCSEIYKGFMSSCYQIPLEILIYNFINYIPSPKAHNIIIHPLSNLISENFNQNLLEIFKKTTKRLPGKRLQIDPKVNYYIPKLTGYPTYDIDLNFLFQIMDINDIIQIYYYILFQVDIFFFSSDTNLLFSIINFFALIVFPFNSLNSICLLSKEEFSFLLKNKSKRIIFTIYGINTTYVQVLRTSSISRFHVIYDIDHRHLEVITPKKEQIGESEIERAKEVDFIQDFIYRLVNKKSVKHKIFGAIFYTLLADLKYVSNKKKNHASLLISFYLEKDNDNNLSIQKVFYKCTQSILWNIHLYFYSQMNYLYKEILFFIDFQPPVRPKTVPLTSYDETLIRILVNNINFINFLNYIDSQQVPESLHIPFALTEEFIYVKNSLHQVNDDLLTSSINNLYSNKNYYTNQQWNENNNISSEKDYIVDFSNFLNYFLERLRDTFFCEGFNTKIINSFKQVTSPHIKKYYYYYTNVELDMNVIYRYAHLMTSKRLDYLLPFNEEIKLIDIPPPIISLNKIANKIELQLKESRKINSEDHLSISMLLIVCLTLIKMEPPYLFYTLNQMTNIDKKPFIRKYLSLILLSYIKILKEHPELIEKVVLGFILVIYYCEIKSIYPNEQIKNVLKMFKQFPIVNEKLKDKKFWFVSIQALSYNPQVKKYEYQFKLKDNYCVDGIHKEIFEEMSKNDDYKGELFYICPLCNKKIVPKIAVKNQVSKWKNMIPLLGISGIYFRCQELMIQYYNLKTMSYSILENELINVISNLLFYLFPKKQTKKAQIDYLSEFLSTIDNINLMKE